MLTENSLRELAKKLNKQVDLWLLPESWEEEMIYFGLSKINKYAGDLMPADFFNNLANDKKIGISKEYADLLKKRLVDALNSIVDIPILSEEMEAALINFFVSFIIDAILPDNDVTSAFANEKLTEKFGADIA